MRRLLTAISGLGLPLLLAASCGPPTPAQRAVEPSCALVAGELEGVGPVRADTRLLISERRGAPTEDRWEQLHNHHTPPPTSTTGVPGTGVTLPFMWPPLFNVKEVAVRTPGGYQVHVLLSFGAAGIRAMDMIQDPDGSWRPLLAIGDMVPSGQSGGPLGADIGRPGGHWRLSGVSVGGDLHVCSPTLGQVERNIFTDRFEGWTDVEMRIGSETGNFTDASCAAVLNPTNGVEELHICGVTDDGKLWHSIESPARTFSPFGDVKAQSGDVGRFKRVACTGNAGQLHLVGLTDDGKVWHTIRIPSRWAPFENVIDAARADPAAQPTPDAGYRDLAIGFCNSEVPADGNRDVSQLNVILTHDDSIWHTIRATNLVQWTPPTPSNWRRMRDLAPSIASPGPGLPPQTRPILWGGVSIGYRPYRP